MEPWQEHRRGLHLPSPLHSLFMVRSVTPMPIRRFPSPWTADETDACFVVKDGSGNALAYVYFEEEPGLFRGGAGTPSGEQSYD
jgi:hypothetical protein